MQRLVYLSNFFLTSGAGVIFVILADLEIDFGLSKPEIGLVAGVGFLASLLASLTLSPYADRGHVFPVATAGVVLGIAGNVMFGFAGGLVAFVAARACIGVGLGLYLAAARKAIIGTDTEGSGRKLGILLSTNVAGFLIGPLLGWLLSDFSFGTPFFVIAGLVAVTAPPTLWWMRNVEVATQEGVRLRDMRPLLTRPRIRGALLGQLFLYGNIGMFDSVADIYLTDLGASERTVALMIWAFGAPLLILPGIAGGVIDKTKPTRVLLVALFAAVPVMASFGIWNSLVVFAVSAVVQGSIESFAFPAAQVVVVRESGAAESAIGQSLLDVSGNLAAATTAVAGPSLYAAGGALAVYGTMAAVGLVLASAASFELRKGSSLAPIDVAVPPLGQTS